MLQVKLVLVLNILAALSKNSSSIRDIDEPLQALIFDSHYNPFVELKLFSCKTDKLKGQKIKFMATGNEYLLRNWYLN
jgi:GTP-binding protein LepA